MKLLTTRILFLKNFIVKNEKWHNKQILATQDNSVKDYCTLVTPGNVTFMGIQTDEIVHFRNIPYALSPTGRNRFKPPILRDFENDTVDGRFYGKKCARNFAENDRSEDCLTVNIAVKKSVLEKNQHVPVIYHIHDGDFNYGDNQIVHKNLIQKENIMVVSIAYRLGVWGFLHLPYVEVGQEQS